MPKAPSSRRGSLRHLQLAFAALLVLSVVLCARAGFAAQGPPAWVQDELLVGLRPGVSRAQAEAMHSLHGATLIDEIPQIHVHRIKVPSGTLEAVERSLSRQPAVKFVERNYIVPPAFVPDDPLYANQWHLPMIAAPAAWDISQGAPRVIIAILDTGVEMSHPDLAAKLVPGYNVVDNNTDTSPVHPHGTQVAGTAAAIGNNGTGVAGVAPENRIMPVRISSFSDGSAFVSDMAEGLIWAVDHGAKVMNLSYAGVAGFVTLKTAARYVVGKGGLVIAAAGNCGCYDATPDNPYIVSVSATDSNDNLTSFSSYGNYVDLSAPGISIWTTMTGGSYGNISGTSFSSPITAGVLALMMSVKPGLTPADYEGLLKATAVDLGPAGYDPSFGWGRVDAYGAVAAAAAFVPEPDTTPPSVIITTPGADSTVSGSVAVDVTARDNIGVTQVNLYLDGAFYASDMTSPYSFYWDTTQVANGPHTLTATASDAAGNVGTSASIPVFVNNGTQTMPPSVTITSVSFGRNELNVSVAVPDNGGVAKVELYVDGQLRGTDTTAPYTFSLNIQWLPSGTHTLEARAYDAAGNVGSVQKTFPK